MKGCICTNYAGTISVCPGCPVHAPNLSMGPYQPKLKDDTSSLYINPDCINWGAQYQPALMPELYWVEKPSPRTLQEKLDYWFPIGPDGCLPE